MNKKRYVTQSVLAAHLGTSRQVVRAWYVRGKIKGVFFADMQQVLVEFIDVKPADNRSNNGYKGGINGIKKKKLSDV